jgi:hypothetical protein
LGKNQPQTDRGQGDDFNDNHLRLGRAGGSRDWLLNGFCHPAKHVRAPRAGQEYYAATVSELDAVPGRFILVGMSVDANQCFTFCAVAGCNYPSVFHRRTLSFASVINPDFPTDRTPQ